MRVLSLQGDLVDSYDPASPSAASKKSRAPSRPGAGPVLLPSALHHLRSTSCSSDSSRILVLRLSLSPQHCAGLLMRTLQTTSVLRAHRPIIAFTLSLAMCSSPSGHAASMRSSARSSAMATRSECKREATLGLSPAVISWRRAFRPAARPRLDGRQGLALPQWSTRAACLSSPLPALAVPVKGQEAHGAVLPAGSARRGGEEKTLAAQDGKCALRGCG